MSPYRPLTTPLNPHRPGRRCELEGPVPLGLISAVAGSLESLSLSGNYLKGTLEDPLWLGMSRLRYLDLSLNPITGWCDAIRGAAACSSS